MGIGPLLYLQLRESSGLKLPQLQHRHRGHHRRTGWSGHYPL